MLLAPKKKEIMMKITSLIGLWLCIVVIGLAPLAQAKPYEWKDLKADEKEFGYEKNHHGWKADKGIEIKIKHHGWKGEKEFIQKTKHHGWKSEYSTYTGQKGYEGFSTIQRSDAVQTTSVQLVPEPETLLSLGIGFIVLTLWYRHLYRRMRTSNSAV